MSDNSGITQESAYEKLKKRSAEIDHLNGIAGILTKDSQTFTAPGSAPDRSLQMQTIADLMHRLITAPEVGQWLDEAESKAATLFADDRRNLFLMRRDWVESNAISAEMAQEFM